MTGEEFEKLNVGDIIKTGSITGEREITAVSKDRNGKTYLITVPSTRSRNGTHTLYCRGDIKKFVKINK